MKAACIYVCNMHMIYSYAYKHPCLYPLYVQTIYHIYIKR